MKRINRWRGHLANTALVCLLLLLARSDWILASVYHRAYPVGSVGIAVGALLLLVAGGMCLPLLWRHRQAHVVAERASGVLLLLLVFYSVQSIARLSMRPPLQLDSLQKLLGLALALAVAVALAYGLPAATWRRLRWAIAAAATIYLATPFVAVPWLAPTVDLALTSHEAGRPPLPTVVLLLDELGVPGGPPLVRRLQSLGATVAAANVAAVGADTINVVPEMFGSRPLPAARVCTFSALCDRDRAFDFARVRFDPRDRVHLVGFYHPYCATQGWQSCLQAGYSGPPIWRSLACSFAGLLPREDPLCEWADAQQWQSMREQVIGAAMNSPFWHDGSFLFVHVALPHPPGRAGVQSLAEDYQANLAMAEEFVAALWTKAGQSFGADFRFVVSSDHSLRSNLWCRTKRYRASGCAVSPDFVDGTVPFLIAQPQPFQTTLPTNNAALLRAR